MAADDGAVFFPGDDGVDEAEFPDAPGEGFQFGIGDAAGVGRVGFQVIDGDMNDGKGRGYVPVRGFHLSC